MSSFSILLLALTPNDLILDLKHPILILKLGRRLHRRILIQLPTQRHMVLPGQVLHLARHFPILPINHETPLKIRRYINHDPYA